MGQVSTNEVGLAYTIETALGVAGTVWEQIEPNGIPTFGATITTVARAPISPNRQRRKGTTTDLDSAVEIDADLTVSAFRDFAEGFLFAVGINTDVTQLSATAATATGNDYTLATALNAAQAAKFVTGAAGSTLLWVKGFTNSANNGLKLIDTAGATTTTLSVSDTLVDETGATAQISFAGYRIAAGETITWAYDAGSRQATLTVTGLGTQLQALGLTAGQFLHIGSIASFGGAIQNAFAADDFGYARVLSISANALVLDKLSTPLQDNTLTDPGVLDLVFGEFLRNVPVGNAAYLTRSFQFEGSYPNLGDGSVGNTDTSYQYAVGNLCNTLAVNIPLTDKATISAAFIGTDTENPTTTRKTGADSAAAPTQTAAYNTTSDVARLRITDVDEDGLTTDFKSLTVNLNNNISPEKVIGVLGARFINTGFFEIDIDAQLLFSNPLVVNRIRDNTTVSMDFIIGNDDGVIVFDVPSMTLGGGDREFPVNETVLINLQAQAFEDATLRTSIGVSIFPVPIP